MVYKIKPLFTKKVLKNKFFEKYSMVLILLFFILLMSIITPSFFTYGNLTNIIRQQTPVAIMAIGVTFAIISGGIDISGGSVIAMSAVSLAFFAQVNSDGSSYPIIVPIIISILVGALAGFLNGLFISYFNIPPFIATLGMMSIARGIALSISKGRPITGFTEAFNFIGGGILFGIPFPIYILIAVYLFGFILLHWTRFGIYVFALGSSQMAAEISGINIKKIKTSIYTLSGMFTGIAAIILASRTLSGQPAVGQGWEMDAITAAIIGGASFTGGVGSVIGTLIGALILGVLANSMTILMISPYVQMIVRGAIIILAVLLDERKHQRG